MKSKVTIVAAISCLAFVSSYAQTAEVPKGFSKGKIVLGNNTTINGYIKDKIRSSAAVIVWDEVTGKKTTYDGNNITHLEIGTDAYLCIRGDFFKVLSQGQLFLLQKSSDASSIPVYNGTEAQYVNGTEGKPGEYFIYTKASGQLQYVSAKKITEVASATMADYTPAVEKAKTANGDMAVLKDAVELYNNRNK